MQLVYATGQRERDFRIADTREEVPMEARVYATCTGDATVENIGEVTFQSMSEEEYYALKAQVREARQRAAVKSESEPESAPSLRQFFGKMFSR